MDEVEYIAHKHLERDAVGRSHRVGDGEMFHIQIHLRRTIALIYRGGGGEMSHIHTNDEVYRCQRRFL